MGTISVSLPSDGETIDVADYNTPINTIVTAINGNLDNSNISASAAISGSKLADGSVASSQLAVGVPVQMTSVSFSAVATGTTVLPVDDTIPQNTEGTEFMTLAITPKSATNILVIESTFMGAPSAADYVSTALFQDSTANALNAMTVYRNDANAITEVTLAHRMVAGTTSATTFKIRAGMGGAGTITFNGNGAARKFGAIPKSALVITEYKAA